MLSEAEQVLVRYLDSSEAQTPKEESSSSHRRVICNTCRTSRSLYCPECLKILLPRDQWPEAIRNGKVRLPFGHLDIVLDDRRTSATGVQVATILQSVNAIFESSVSLFDKGKGDVLPSYDDSKEKGVYLLFPCASSEPLSSVLSSGRSLQKLVVLDCKWSRSSVRLDPSIAKLPRIHLDNAPQHSYYWRWHNAGDGMISTVEAIYFASWQAATALGWTQKDRHELVHLLWLFGLQRQHIRHKYEVEAGKSFPSELPFDMDGKEQRRALRRKHPLRKKQHKERAQELSTIQNATVP